MATYKQPCIHCGELIDGDNRFCPKCANRSPFGYQCPFCLKPVQRGNVMCSSCGRSLMTTCPLCKGQTFTGADKCDSCGISLMVLCTNKNCGQYQFFENTKCTACGKKIKNGIEQLKKRK
ncbi:MAG: zinc ribbon domain-containing protein [Methanomassiliicoccaceae archaeon]|nr:zinc ribbon domain-containing protein [Methanomassiliicoccaceae archaeon]